MRISSVFIILFAALLVTATATKKHDRHEKCFKKVKKCCWKFRKCGYKTRYTVHKYDCNFKKCYPKCYKVCHKVLDYKTHKYSYKCYKSCKEHCIKVIAVCKQEKWFVAPKFCPKLYCGNIMIVGDDKKPDEKHGDYHLARKGKPTKHIIKYIKPKHHEPHYLPHHKH